MDTQNKKVLIEVKNLSKHFAVRDKGHIRYLKAVDEVTFSLYENETFSLVGETGCGKSTTGRTLLHLIKPTYGEVLYEGRNILDMNRKELKKLRQDLQIVFQDPYSSLNPRMTIGQILEEPLIIHKLCNSSKERMRKSLDIMEKVGLRPDQYYRYPHEFSGGQKQRIGIARAFF